MNDNLPELRDIHLPEGVSAFPPAYGWWVLLATAILLILLYQLIVFLRQKSKKLFAFKLLKELDGQDIIHDAVIISELLRRICVYKYRSAVALTGQEWIDFLNDKTKNKISDRPANLLLNAPYAPKDSKIYTSQDLESIKSFAKTWIGENL